MNVIIWLVIGGLAGWIAGLIVQGTGFGLIGDIVIGILGALIAGSNSKSFSFLISRSYWFFDFGRRFGVDEGRHEHFP